METRHSRTLDKIVGLEEYVCYWYDGKSNTCLYLAKTFGHQPSQAHDGSNCFIGNLNGDKGLICSIGVRGSDELKDTIKRMGTKYETR
jgi:hypothetical protein